ncbi:MAG: hypothetical protein QOK04_2820 [Solirubrobacteraceae bacterium]|jgi:hypothetical protein|nr:hypothetical protein [Solirubrobacteraceae bacterium]MEA2427079.1 hypothetical protein [Thermoleophilaceae bacterium]
MRFRVGFVLLAAACLVLFAGCGDSKKKSAKKSAPASKVTSPNAKVSFVAPKDGSTQGTTVAATVKVAGFTLSPATVGQPAKAGQGHLHFALDNGKFDYPKYSGANGQLAEKLGVAGKYSPSVSPTITYKGLPKGKHELEVYLANNDHTNAGPEAKTEFTVK